MQIIENIKTIYAYNSIDSVLILIPICVAIIIVLFCIIYQLTLNQTIIKKIFSILVILAMTIIGMNFTDNLLQKYINKNIKTEEGKNEKTLFKDKQQTN